MNHACLIAIWQVLINHPTEDRRLSWPGWLITYRDCISAKWPSISVLTGPDVEQLHWYAQRRYHYATPPPLRPIEWRQYEWPWVTLKVTRDVRCLTPSILPYIRHRGGGSANRRVIVPNAALPKRISAAGMTDSWRIEIWRLRRPACCCCCCCCCCVSGAVQSLPALTAETTTGRCALRTATVCSDEIITRRPDNCERQDRVDSSRRRTCANIRRALVSKERR